MHSGLRPGRLLTQYLHSAWSPPKGVGLRKLVAGPRAALAATPFYTLIRQVNATLCEGVASAPADQGPLPDSSRAPTACQHHHRLLCLSLMCQPFPFAFPKHPLVSRRVRSWGNTHKTTKMCHDRHQMSSRIVN